MEWNVEPRLFDRLSHILGVNLWVQEEYLHSYPFAGNKWVKLRGEYGDGKPGAAYITNGGINSNHCRTLAVWSAFHGHRCHLVLHNDKSEDEALPLSLLSRLGATYTVVNSRDIAETISQVQSELQEECREIITVPGGGHSPKAVHAYSSYAAEVITNRNFDYIFHASGTGGTQAGLCLAKHDVGSSAQVVGISVARAATRGKEVIRETIKEASGLELEVDFRDAYVDGGYGSGGAATRQAIEIAGQAGLFLDATYTGKAFAGLLDAIETGEILPGASVLFWHTGGTAYINERHMSID